MDRKEALQAVRKLIRTCELEAGIARRHKDYSNARHFAAKVEAYEMAEQIILAIEEGE